MTDYRRLWLSDAKLALCPRHSKPVHETVRMRVRTPSKLSTHSVLGRSSLLGLCALLSACASLPASGPTARQITRGVNGAGNTIGFKLVSIDGPVLQSIAEREATAYAGEQTLRVLAAEGENDVVGPGDVLSVSVYEVGVSLFGQGRIAGDAFDPSARGENFPVIVVDREGVIKLPFIGRLAVAGRTPADIQDMIEQGLRGQSQNPQALVTVKENVSRTVYVAGDVRRPGRFDLTLQREHLLDAIAAAGGASNSAEDTIVRFNRGERTIEQRLGRIKAGEPDDLTLIPGDRIELIKRPRTFIVLGATSKVAQVPFETGDVSLAEAVARAGGPMDSSADPSAIFVFRYEPSGVTGKIAPVVYRLNMLKPTSYFLSQRFAVRDKDVIYIGNAAANQPAKLVAILNQLFSPFVTARAITRP